MSDNFKRNCHYVFYDQDVDVFLAMYLDLCGQDYCGFMLKKSDKKKDRYVYVCMCTYIRM